MNHVLSLQGLELAKSTEGVAVMDNSTQSNGCGNGNSSLSVACK